MNVASLEPCKELYELSGWNDTEFWYAETLNEPPHNWTLGNNRLTIGMTGGRQLPAYDLGYLLRKLPTGHRMNGFDHFLTVQKWNKLPGKPEKYTALLYGRRRRRLCTYSRHPRRCRLQACDRAA
jgi:hypothetical protein